MSAVFQTTTTDSSGRGPLHRPAQSSSAFTERRQRLRQCSKGCQQKCRRFKAEMLSLTSCNEEAPQDLKGPLQGSLIVSALLPSGERPALRRSWPAQRCQAAARPATGRRSQPRSHTVCFSASGEPQNPQHLEASSFAASLTLEWACAGDSGCLAAVAVVA